VQEKKWQEAKNKKKMKKISEVPEAV